MAFEPEPVDLKELVSSINLFLFKKTAHKRFPPAFNFNSFLTMYSPTRTESEMT